jgi:hypothetical protein
MATNRADSELPNLDEIPSIRVHDILEQDVHLAPIRQNDATALWNTFHPGSESIGNYIDVGFYDQTSAGRAIEQWNNSMRDGTTVALGIYTLQKIWSPHMKTEPGFILNTGWLLRIRDKG